MTDINQTLPAEKTETLAAASPATSHEDVRASAQASTEGLSTSSWIKPQGGPRKRNSGNHQIPG